MDLHSNIKASPAIVPVVVADNTAQVSQILDTANYDSNELLIVTGTLADVDATFAVLLEEGDQANMSDAAAVADADLIGTEAEAGFTFADDGVARKLGYKGKKRYLRATITPANNAGNAPMAAIWLQGTPRKAPLS